MTRKLHSAKKLDLTIPGGCHCKIRCICDRKQLECVDEGSPDRIWSGRESDRSRWAKKSQVPDIPSVGSVHHRRASVVERIFHQHLRPSWSRHRDIEHPRSDGRIRVQFSEVETKLSQCVNILISPSSNHRHIPRRGQLHGSLQNRPRHVKRIILRILNWMRGCQQVQRCHSLQKSVVRRPCVEPVTIKRIIWIPAQDQQKIEP